MALNDPNKIIDEKRFLIQRSLARLEERKDYTPDIIQSNFQNIADFSRAIANSYGLLQKKEEALKFFQQSVQYYIKANEISENQGGRLRYVHALRLLDTVIPLQDQDLYNKISIIIEGLEPEPVPGSDRIDTELFEAYLDDMACLLREEYDVAFERLPRLRRYEERDWKDCKYYEGLSDAIEGIIKEDKELFINGIERILQIFKKRNAQLKQLPICSEATSLFILGKRRGLNIALKDIKIKLRDLIPEVLI